VPFTTLTSAVVASIVPAAFGAASPSPSPSPVEIDPNRVSPGLLGLASLLFLVLAVFVLWKSMNKQLKRVDFDEDTPVAD
jgi:hypothetical protein